MSIHEHADLNERVINVEKLITSNDALLKSICSNNINVEKLLTNNNACVKSIYSNNEKLRREVLYIKNQMPVATNLGDERFSSGHIGENMSLVTQVAEEPFEPPRVLNRPCVRNKHPLETREETDTTGHWGIAVAQEEDSNYVEIQNDRTNFHSELRSHYLDRGVRNEVAVESSSEDDYNMNEEDLWVEDDLSHASKEVLSKMFHTTQGKIESLATSIKGHEGKLSRHKQLHGQDSVWSKKVENIRKRLMMLKKLEERKHKIKHSLKLLRERGKSNENIEAVNNAEVIISRPSISYEAPRSRKGRENSVIDCGISRKISAKEKDAMDIRELAKDEDPCDDMFECEVCLQTFASAGPLAAHTRKHYNDIIINKSTRMECPWRECDYANTQEKLTKHLRSVHTKEDIFPCQYCNMRFYSIEVKRNHEKKHMRQEELKQCESCRRFYKVQRGACSFCRNK